MFLSDVKTLQFYHLTLFEPPAQLIMMYFHVITYLAVIEEHLMGRNLDKNIYFFFGNNKIQQLNDFTVSFL